MKLGTFIKDSNGALHGKINALGIGSTSVIFEPTTSKMGKSYFRLVADPTREAYEIGNAWEKKKDGMTYYSVSLESPAFSGPLNGALFADQNKPNLFNLIWDRPEQQSPKAEATVVANGNGQNRPLQGAQLTP